VNHHISTKPQYKYLAALIIFLCLIFLSIFLFFKQYSQPQRTITNQIIQAAAAHGVKISTASPIVEGNIVLTEKNKNQPLIIRTGSTIRVILHSTFYNFYDLQTNILQQIGQPVYFHSGEQAYGSGSVTVVYKVVKPGFIVISARRTLCKLHCEGHGGDFHEPIIVLDK
jgi:hypothetical protein